MKRILIALDYNPTAQKVAESGYSLAKAMKAEVILLHVISDIMYYSSTAYSPIMGFTGYMDTGAFQIDAPGGLEKTTLHYLDKTRLHLGDKSIKTIVRTGEFAETIVKAAKELDIDMIVMGTHSRKWLENIIMGSVAEKVLHLSTIPLYIIPTKKND